MSYNAKQPPPPGGGSKLRSRRLAGSIQDWSVYEVASPPLLMMVIAALIWRHLHFQLEGLITGKAVFMQKGRQLDPHNNGVRRAAGKRSHVNFIDKFFQKKGVVTLY